MFSSVRRVIRNDQRLTELSLLHIKLPTLYSKSLQFPTRQFFALLLCIITGNLDVMERYVINKMNLCQAIVIIIIIIIIIIIGK